MGPDEWNPAERYYANWPWKLRLIEWIELLTADIVEILCGERASDSSNPLAQAPSAHGERQSAFAGTVEPDSGSEKVPTAGSPRPLSEKAAGKFAANYIDRERLAGKHPTQSGLEAAAKEANWRGGREFLREAFRQIEGVTRGRPRNSPTKPAKK
jgi:hypothetical protein